MLRGVLVGMLENQRGSLGADHRAHQQEDQRNSRDAPDLFRHFVCIISRRSGRQSGASFGSVTLRTNSLARHVIGANPASSGAMLPMTVSTAATGGVLTPGEILRHARDARN